MTKQPNVGADEREAKELLPCPFCGGKAKTYYNTNTKFWFIQCCRCKLKYEFAFHDDGEAIANWNTRPDFALAAVRDAERYKAMRDICVDALEESYRKEAGELFHSNWRGRLKYHLFDDTDVRLIIESHGTEREKQEFEAFRQRRREALEGGTKS